MKVTFKNLLFLVRRKEPPAYFWVVALRNSLTLLAAIDLRWLASTKRFATNWALSFFWFNCSIKALSGTVFCFWSFCQKRFITILASFSDPSTLGFPVTGVITILSNPLVTAFKSFSACLTFIFINCCASPALCLTRTVAMDLGSVRNSKHFTACRAHSWFLRFVNNITCTATIFPRFIVSLKRLLASEAVLNHEAFPLLPFGKEVWACPKGLGYSYG